MVDDMIALRAGLNVLNDSIESRRMPSGLPLDGTALDLHRKAVAQLETLLAQQEATDRCELATLCGS
jgi:hypothetical protein